MNPAIHFPQPVAIDDEPVLEVLSEPKRRRPSRRTIALSVVAIGILAVVSWAVVTYDATPDTAPIEAAGTAEITVREFVAGTGQHYVAGTAVVQSEYADNTWTFVVATEVLALAEGGFVPAGIHYFSVPVALTGETWSSVRPPGQVAGPPVIDTPHTAVSAPIDSPITDAVQAYVDWLLTGAPGGYDGARPTPAPYKSATVTGMATDSSDDAAITVVEVLAVDRYGNAITLTYELTVSNQLGLWVVSR